MFIFINYFGNKSFIWDKIIYANPIKPIETLHELDRYKPLVTYDNHDEVKKIAMHAASMKPTVISYKDLSAEFIDSENKAIIADIEKENEELVRLGKPLKNIPEFVSKQQLTDEAVTAAENAMKEELLAQGKPEKIIGNIVKGKIARWIEDNSQLDRANALLSQTYVMDDSMTVEEAIKACDASIELVEYVRFELGEGIEKKEEDFAAEVAAQMGQ